MKLPKTYKRQPGCWNCEHCFSWSTYESCFYTCNVANKRPLFMVYAAEEELKEETMRADALSQKECDKALYKWMDWQNDHTVDTWGICDDYKKKNT